MRSADGACITASTSGSATRSAIGRSGRALDRVDQVDAPRGGHLGQAGDGRVGALPQELEVDGGAALGAGLGHHGVHSGGVPDGLELGQPRYPSRPCKRSRSARPSGHGTSSPTSPSASTPATAWPSSGATARARRRCCGSSPAGSIRTAARSACRAGATVALHDQRPPLGSELTLEQYVGEGMEPARRAEADLAALEARMAGRRPRRRGDGRLRGGAGAPGAGRRLRLACLDGARAARSRHRRGGAPAAARELLGRRADPGVAGAVAGVAARRPAAGRAHEPPRHRGGRVAGAHDRRARRGRGARLPRPLVPRVGGDRRAGARPRPRQALADGLLGLPARAGARARPPGRRGRAAGEGDRPAGAVRHPLARRHQGPPGRVAPEAARPDRPGGEAAAPVAPGVRLPQGGAQRPGGGRGGRPRRGGPRAAA